MSEKPTRAALYMRCSTAHQSLDIQRRDLVLYAAARRWEVTGTFEDFAVSGKRDTRPALDAMIRAARRRTIDVIMVWRLDRLGRNTRHLLGLIEELEGLGVSLVSYQEALDLSTPMGRAMVTILSALAAFERELIRERVVAGIENARRNGKRLGRPRSIDREQIRRLRADGLTFRQIMSKLGVSNGAVQAALEER